MCLIKQTDNLIQSKSIRAISIFLAVFACLIAADGHENKLNTLNFPINARAEIMLPITNDSTNQNALLTMLKSIFKNVGFRNAVKKSHYTIFVRSHINEKQLAHNKLQISISLHARVSLSNGKLLDNIKVYAISNGQQTKKESITQKAFVKVYNKLYMRILINKLFIQSVVNGISKDYNAKSAKTTPPPIKSNFMESLAVTTILVKHKDNKNNQYRQRYGSAFFINTKGLLLTNYHVINEAKSIQVKLQNNKLYKASIISKDEWMDLALIQIRLNYPHYLPLNFDYTGYKIGDEVIAIGSPYKKSGTISKGIISSVRNHDGFTLIQTDAAINPGNSGGPLIHFLSRQVIGINTFGISSDNVTVGINFSISLSTIKTFLDQNKHYVELPDLNKSIPVNANTQMAAIFTDKTSGKSNQSNQIENSTRKKPAQSHSDNHKLNHNKSYIITVFSSEIGEENYNFSSSDRASESVADFLEQELIKSSKNSIIAHKIAGNTALRYSYEGKNSIYSRKLCSKYKANGIISFFSEQEPGLHLQRPVEYSYYDCRSGSRTQNISYINHFDNEQFPFSQDIQKSFNVFLRKITLLQP